jgi:lipoprotein-anchoring transpeptidase ErfK/SrfK
MRGHRALIAGRLWRMAVLTVAGAIGPASQAQADLYYWDSDPGYYRPGPTAPQRRQKPHHRQAKKIEAPEKESAKPQGPLIIAISIEKQNLKIYDANGFFAEAPVSTGMRGHPTPMGIFSVIQKHKLHHSNIYSGAPMPYMQRITWSGVAIHAGVLPGYPASHGCIRMPMAFAVKMWNWTKMGARVVITPGEMTPASFSHPLLVAQKVVPRPIAEPQADAPPAAKSDKASDADTTIKPAISEASLELRSTVGHDDGVKPVIGDPSASTSRREQTHTADSSGDTPATRPSVTMTDAAPSGSNASSRQEPAARTDSATAITEDAASVKAGDTSKPDAKPEAAKSEAETVNAKPGETASSNDKPVETKPLENAIAEIKPAETGTTGEAGKKPDEANVAAQPDSDAVRTEGSATQGAKAEEAAGGKKAEAKADDAKTAALKPDAPKSSEKSNEKRDESVKAVTGISTAVPDAKKDPARLPDTAKPAAGKTDPASSAAPKRTGQTAVFISRKDSKLYVRQNFAPLFDVPVTIAPSDRPLGTHVFTAQVDKDDANVVHWSVVSLPVPARHAERRDEDGRALRKRKIAGAAVEVKPLPVPDSPAEALDRLTIPADAMARITEALSTGASIIVSDQGIGAGETGEGTDFIVSLR